MGEPILYWEGATGCSTRNVTGGSPVDLALPSNQHLGFGDSELHRIESNDTDLTVTLDSGDYLEILSGGTAKKSIKLGDAADASFFEILDSGDVQVARIGSGGDMQLDGGLDVDGAASDFAGDVVVQGNLTVNGTRIENNTTILNSDDDYHTLSQGNQNTAAGQTAGLAMVTQATATADDTTGAGVFTAGVASTSNPTVTTSGTATFAAGDLISISGSNSNDGVYEVLSHVGTTLTIRGVGTTATVHDFSQNQFTADTDTGATITKVNVTVFKATETGVFSGSFGSTTTDITNNEATFSTAAAPGFVEAGSNTILSTLGNEVGIGIATPGGKLQVVADAAGQIPVLVTGASGQTADLFVVETDGGTDVLTLDASGDATFAQTVTITNTLTANGNTVIGSDDTDTVVFNADMASDLLPDADATRDLGASGASYAEIWMDGADLGSTSGAGVLGADSSGIANSSSSNVQGVLDDLDDAIADVQAIFTREGTTSRIHFGTAGDELYLADNASADLDTRLFVNVDVAAESAVRIRENVAQSAVVLLVEDSGANALVEIQAGGNVTIANDDQKLEVSPGKGVLVYRSASSDFFVGTEGTNAASTDSEDLTIGTGAAQGTTSNGGNITLSPGPGTQSNGVLFFEYNNNPIAQLDQALVMTGGDFVVQDNRNIHVGTGNDLSIVSDGTNVSALAQADLTVGAANGALSLVGATPRLTVSGLTTTGASVGDLVNISANNTTQTGLADGATAGREDVFGVVSATGEVTINGVVEINLNDDAGGVQAGQKIFLSPDNAGRATNDPSVLAVGEFEVPVGYILNDNGHTTNGDPVIAVLSIERKTQL